MRLEVYLNAWGERRFVGLLEERGGDILFEYDKRFLDSGIELSPFLLPLRPGVASDPKRTFDGLFGVFNDSLPNGWGLLCWTACCGAAACRWNGSRPVPALAGGGAAAGALEYEPVTPDPDPLPERIDLDGVAEEAWRTLNEDRCPWRRCVHAHGPERLLRGGAAQDHGPGVRRQAAHRADAVAEPGCDPWLIKFPALP